MRVAKRLPALPGRQTKHMSKQDRIHELIISAIQQMRLVRLHYKGPERIVEPHDYGIKNGSAKLLASRRLQYKQTAKLALAGIEPDVRTGIAGSKLRGRSPHTIGKDRQWDTRHRSEASQRVVR